nr:transient receptor potential channel pyrexia-like [Leptinotarsa decemlineata]
MGLHEAVLNGDLEGVRQLLKQDASVNEVDSSGNTPLLLAVCVKEDEIYNSIVAELIQAGADVNIYNKGFTPLYNAVFYKRAESVEMLLKAGAWLRPAYRNELHLIAEIGGSNILSLILNDKRCTPDIINCSDEEGRTALHIAAQFCHKNCLRMLIEHGGDLAVLNDEKESVADIIFEQIVNPEKFIRNILDRSIVMEQTDKYRSVYNVDFSVLAPKNCERQMEVISQMLVSASEEEKIEVLQHPLIELYLVLKWSRICYFFYFWISIYFIFSVSMGVYVSLMIQNFRNEVLTKVIKYILILTSTGLLGHAILQGILIRRYYFQRYEIWMNLICTSLSLTVAVVADDVIRDTQATPDWVLHITSIAVLLAWIELMLLIGRLPSLGYYALMFSAVLQNVVKVMLAFLCLLIGFTLSFSIQFHTFEQFGDPWRALVKTTVMMMGEFEFSDLFAESTSDPPFLPATSRIIFLFFIILTSIVLMNLMVGVAVSDIQELHRRGRAKKLEKQAEFLCQLEKVISSKHLNSKFIPAVIRNVLVRRSFIHTKYEVKTCATFQRSHNIPRRIIDSIASIGKVRKQISEDE